jgi:hypothetical protein
MKEHHRLAATLAVRMRRHTLDLPKGATTVAAQLGNPISRDRITGKTMLLHVNSTKRLPLAGQAIKGGVLSPCRPRPGVSGAIPLALTAKRRRRRVLRRALAFLTFVLAAFADLPTC